MERLRNFLIIITILTFCVTCTEEPQPDLCISEATVVDLTGLDGCGFILQLDDGTRLEPVRLWYCGTGMDPDDIPVDPLIGFDFYDGQRVKFGYEPAGMASICMVGQTVRVTCIEEIHIEYTTQ